MIESQEGEDCSSLEDRTEDEEEDSSLLLKESTLEAVGAGEEQPSRARLERNRGRIALIWGFITACWNNPSIDSGRGLLSPGFKPLLWPKFQPQTPLGVLLLKGAP